MSKAQVGHGGGLGQARVKLRSGMVDGGAYEVVERLCRVRHVFSRRRDPVLRLRRDRQSRVRYFVLRRGRQSRGPAFRFHQRPFIKSEG